MSWFSHNLDGSPSLAPSFWLPSSSPPLTPIQLHTHTQTPNSQLPSPALCAAPCLVKCMFKSQSRTQVDKKRGFDSCVPIAAMAHARLGRLLWRKMWSCRPIFLEATLGSMRNRTKTCTRWTPVSKYGLHPEFRCLRISSVTCEHLTCGVGPPICMKSSIKNGIIRSGI